MPARATELETYKIANGRSMQRNVYVLCRQIFFFVEYSKSRVLTALNRGVCRFLDVQCSALLDLLLVRPIVCLFASLLDRNEAGIYNSDLFIVGGLKLEGPVIRNIFACLFLSTVGVPLLFLTTDSWLNITILFSGLLLCTTPHDDDDLDQESTHAYDEQFAHSSQTANLH